MDIRQAKEELRRMVLAYTERTEDGQLRIPMLHQRPALLMGPPGVGKTAILSQLADELHIGLVAYTMTHHTRQSALGLPLIREKQYGGKTCSATEYTMSEILAAVYDRMEQTGTDRGILFLDEINCVSETLMPAMLQLLQSKQFGTHRLPEGWVIAAAGNPPQYNQSARLFDTATMDRVRLLEIEESYPVWRSYAHAHGLHPAILAYLELNPEHFYCVEPHAHGRSFVTARLGGSLRNALQLRTAGLSNRRRPVRRILAASADRGLIRSVFSPVFRLPGAAGCDSSAFRRVGGGCARASCASV